ncbi:ser/Thr protein phosphatase family protein [Lineolata rhizophorae]|uniref:Ser/Thr protein phosphatase family protein n=1 Tax=Lineolata rhizophorae TaxID=578093 RepID=A0A6A6P9H6_9PEZI|nr:ser/Thr protein phosphatase family protein [Lineolata rhizophorae]
MAATATAAAASPQSIRTRFLIISDTHNATPQSWSDLTCAFRHPLPAADVAIHCGDLTYSGRLEEYAAAIETLASVDAELKLVIAGNHDMSLDAEYYAERGALRHGRRFDPELPSKARDMWLGPEGAARRAGITYLEEGMHRFRLKSGARLNVYASPYQPEFCYWAFPYQRDEDRFNPAPAEPDPSIKNIATNPVPDFPEVDVMMTHGPPLYHLDRTVSLEDVGCAHLLRAAARARPRLHCFGHIHEGWGAERVKWANGTKGLDLVARTDKFQWNQDAVLQNRAAHVNVSSTESLSSLEFGRETLMVNASIMSVRYKPVNAPWLIDLDLPAAGEQKE